MTPEKQAILDAATPRPWVYQEDSDAYTHIARGSRGEHLFQGSQTTNGESESTIRLAVLAVNSYESDAALIRELVGALKEIQRLSNVPLKQVGLLAANRDCIRYDASEALAHARQQKSELFEEVKP